MNVSKCRTPPRIGEAPSGRILFFASLGLLGAGAVLVLFLYNPAKFGFYPECYLYRTTGLLCPGCGSLRALYQLLHGHLLRALHDNILLVFSLPLLIWGTARYLLARLRNLPVPFRVRPWLVWCAVAVMVAFGIVRNLPVGRALGLAPYP
jgi:Protein of unknown function (DUF2752)